MAFLDNSGDIILDAVLTDTGRMRLAKGDGSFNIVKFALGDDEINYELYDKNHASGSAYYDIEILQTPVLEAFTNNTSTMKSKLLSISRTDHLYLPVIKRSSSPGIDVNTVANIICIAADTNTKDVLYPGSTGTPDSSKSLNAGMIDGAKLNTMNDDTRRLIFDQGMDSNALGATGDVALAADLVETQYILEIDHRLGFIADPDGNMINPSFIDDDDIASYFLSVTTNPEFFDGGTLITNSSVLAGPAGYRLKFLIGSSTNLQTSTYLFTQLGSADTDFSGVNHKIDTTVRVTGATTGFRVDVPIRFLKS